MNTCSVIIEAEKRTQRRRQQVKAVIAVFRVPWSKYFSRLLKMFCLAITTSLVVPIEQFQSLL